MTHATRRAALRGLLRAADVEALLVTDLVNVRYLTGFTGSNASLLLHVDGDPASRFCTDGRYATQSARAAFTTVASRQTHCCGACTEMLPKSPPA